MLLSEMLRQYAVNRDVSAATIITYSAPCSSLGRFLGRPACLGDLAPGTVNEWLTWLVERVSRETAYSYRRHLLAIWREAQRSGFTAESPERVKRIRRPERIIEGFDAADMAKMLAVADKHKRRVWWRIFLQVAWFSGLRLADVLSIERPWIWPGSDGGGFLSIVQNKTWGTVPRALPASLMREIDASLAPGQRLICGLWCRREAFYRMFKRLAKKAGLRGTSKYIRRGSSSEVERLCPGAGRLHVGHKSAGTWEKHYRVERICQPKIILPPPIA